MKKLILLFVLFDVFQGTLFSQSCLPYGIEFYTQVEIDSFQVNYPNCTEIEGDVLISGNDITNLNGLLVLSSIAGSLVIESASSLTCLYGLNNLTSIGGILIIDQNSALINMVGLNGLISIGDHFEILQNISLTSLTGLDNLTSIGGDFNIGCSNYPSAGNPLLNDISALNSLLSISGTLEICHSESLINLTGLNNLVSVGGISIKVNQNLNSLIGLENISTIGEDLYISATPITNLEALENLSFIGGDLTIRDISSLHNLTGLNNLVSVGGIRIYSNQNLNSLIGLENISTIGEDLYISDNPITNFAALDNLSYIGEDLVIQDNSSLTSLTGLDNLTDIGGKLTIDHNESLTSLTALSSLNSIGGDLQILSNYELSSLTALNSLTSIGGELEVTSNTGITSLEGLDNIDPASITALTIYSNQFLNECAISSICSFLANPTGPVDINQNANGCGNPLEIASICGITLSCLPFGHYHFCSQAEVDNFPVNYPGCTDLGGNLRIHGCFGGNSDITNLDSLNVVTSMNGDLVIDGNNMLTDLSGLENISQGSINNLGILFNSSLSSCSIQSICAFLANPTGTIYITLNATGCNSQEEVEAACGVGVEESSVVSCQSSVSIYPNPSSATITIELPEPTPEFQISIFNFSGQEVINRHITGTDIVIDISQLPQGLYFVRVVDDKGVLVGKFVKQ